MKSSGCLMCTGLYRENKMKSSGCLMCTGLWGEQDEVKWMFDVHRVM